MRLGALAVLVATFVGLPALGRSMGTNAFDKLDAVNYLSSVLLAEDYSYSSGSSTYTAPTYTEPTTTSSSSTTTYPTTYDSTMYSGSSSSYTYPTTSSSSTSTYPTTSTYPSAYDSTTHTDSSTSYTYPTTSTTGTYSTGTSSTSSGMLSCSTAETCMTMYGGAAADYTCMNGYCGKNSGMTSTYNTSTYSTGTSYTGTSSQYNTNTQSNTYGSTTGTYGSTTGAYDPNSSSYGSMQNYGTYGSTDTKGMYGSTGMYSNYMPQGGTYSTATYAAGSVNGYYTDSSARSTNYGEYSDLYSSSQYDASECTGDYCGGISQYGFSSCTEEGCTFEYESEGSETALSASQLSSQAKQLSQMLKQYSNVAKDWTRFSSRTSRMAQKFANVATQIDSVGGDASLVEELIAATAAVDSDVTSTISEINTYYTSLESSVSALTSNTEATEGDVESLRTAIQLLGTYNMLSMAVDARVNAIQQSDPLADLAYQIAKVEASEVSDETASSIEELKASVEELVGYVDEAYNEYVSVAQEISDVRNTTDADAAQSGLQDLYSISQDIQSFMQEMGSAFMSFMDSRPWDVLMEAQQYAQTQHMAGSMADELGMMKEQINEAKTFLNAVKALKISQASFVKALDNLYTSADKMLSVVDKMKSIFDSSESGEIDQATMEKFFGIQDQIMQVVDTNMAIVTDYLNSNKSLWSSSSNKSIIEKFLQQEEEMEMNYDDQYEDFDLIYGTEATTATGEEVDMEALRDAIKAELLEEIMSEISSSLMTELAAYIGDDAAGEMISNFLNKSSIFGEKGTAALEATADVLDAISAIPSEDDAVITEGTEDEVEELLAVVEDIKEEVIAEESSEELSEVLETVADLLTTGADADELTAATEDLQKLVAENDEALTEDKMQYPDMKLKDSGDMWYFDSVMSLTQEGVVKGKSEGYDPSAEVTYAEVAKMAMEASDIGKTNGTPEDDSAVGQWYEDYVVSVEKYAPEFAGEVVDWNAPCPREMVAVLIAEAYDLPESDYNGEYDDMSSSDEHAGYVQSMYDYGVMTGSDGSFRPEDGINRAEVATVIHRAAESVGVSEDIDETLDSADEDLDAILEELGVGDAEDDGREIDADNDGVVDSENETVSKLSTAWNFVKAMLPFLN